MNKEALKLSIETEYAVYWSRSRKKLWKKGKKVVFIKKLKEFLLTMIKIALSYLLNYKEFKLAVTLDINRVFTDKLRKKGKFSSDLVFNEDKKVFDPEKSLQGLDNPTKL